MTKTETLKILQISNDIDALYKDKDEMSNGDFQGCLEAIVWNALQAGKELERGKA